MRKSAKISLRTRLKICMNNFFFAGVVMNSAKIVGQKVGDSRIGESRGPKSGSSGPAVSHPSYDACYYCNNVKKTVTAIIIKLSGQTGNAIGIIPNLPGGSTMQCGIRRHLVAH